MSAAVHAPLLHRRRDGSRVQRFAADPAIQPRSAASALMNSSSEYVMM